MRSSSVSSLLPLLAASAVACDGEPLIGPEAQAAYEGAAAVQKIVSEDLMVFLDDERLPPGKSLDEIDPQTIVRIEVLKSAAAGKLFGEQARSGVIRIYTSEGARP